MKKIYFIITWTLLIISFILFLILINIKNINNSLDIEKTIVKIIPEKELINYTNNPLWINLNNNYWIWLGFFINKENNILTSNHIIENKNLNYIIITHDNKKYKAKIISQDFKNDLAIISINSEKIYNNLELNKNIGYKLNEKIVSFWFNIESNQIEKISGEIININKKLDNMSNLIEFIPKISKWYSGWPIFNLQNEVIWINYAIRDWKSYWIQIWGIY
jgi:hypothetical protein